jgi:predicted membrane-bound mannosyltransferase
MFEKVYRCIEVVKDSTALSARKETLADRKEEARCAVLDAKNAVRIVKKAAGKVAQAISRLRNGQCTMDAMDKAIVEAERLQAAAESTSKKRAVKYIESCTDFIAGEQRLKVASAAAGVTLELVYALYLQRLGDTADEVAAAIAAEDAAPPPKRCCSERR